MYDRLSQEYEVFLFQIKMGIKIRKFYTTCNVFNNTIYYQNMIYKDKSLFNRTVAKHSFVFVRVTIVVFYRYWIISWYFVTNGKYREIVIKASLNQNIAIIKWQQKYNTYYKCEMLGNMFVVTGSYLTVTPHFMCNFCLYRPCFS